MLAWLKQLFVPLVFEDEEKTRVARLLNTVVLAVLAGAVVITLAALAVFGVRSDAETAYTLISGIVMTVSLAGLLILARRGKLWLVSVVLLTFSWTVVTLWIYTVSGIASDSSALAYALIVVLAGLLLGGRAAMIMTGVSIVAVLGAYYAEASGLLVVVDRPVALTDALFIIIPLFLTGVLLRYAINSIYEAMDRARRNEQAQIEANRELEMLRASLEERVAERTYELERRSVQLQAATEVGRAATSILDVDELMWRVVERIQERFGLYHVGLLLLDGTGQGAVYRAGSGAAGRELWEQGFRLRVGGNSMVGWCTANAQARIAQDVSQDAVYLGHELVPATRSEAALPLIARGQVLGAISAQSDQPGTFDPDTVAALQTMADQVAIALENARLYTESQQALEATRRAYAQYSQEAWSRLLGSRPEWGYSFVHQTVLPSQGDWQPEMVEAVQTGHAVVRSTDPVGGEPLEAARPGDGAGGLALALPLRVRDDVIGVLSFYKDAKDGAWRAEEAELLQRLVEQLGAALESAQLFQETQRRAAREQAIRQVTEQMHRSVDIEAILQSTVVELAKALGVPRAYVRLGTEQELLPNQRAEPSGEHHPANRLAERTRPVSVDPGQIVPVSRETENA